MSGSPWLSVLMPIYNGGKFLPEALKSIICQDEKDIEIIAVDDGSEDGSVAILESFSGWLPIRIIRRQREGNWVAGTNMGLACARAEHVCFLHQDDVWFPQRLKALKRLVQAARGAVMVVHASQFIDKNGRHLGTLRCPLPGGELLSPARVMESLLVQDFIAVPAAVFRRAAALAVGGLDAGLWYSADWDFWLKLAGAGSTFYWPAALTGFRIHRLSQTMARCDAIGEMARQATIVQERHLGVWAKRLTEAPEVERVGRFANQLNHFLCQLFHGRGRIAWLGVFRSFLALGPSGWQRFFRDSRISERVNARLRAGLFGKGGLHDEAAHLLRCRMRGLGWLSQSGARGRGRGADGGAGALPPEIQYGQPRAGGPALAGWPGS